MVGAPFGGCGPIAHQGGLGLRDRSAMAYGGTIPDVVTETGVGAPTHEVAVVGCGLMGSALARILAGRGHAVVVWNRTHSRAVALEGPNIQAVKSADDAVAATPVVVACQTTYDNVRASLGGVADWGGRTLVNLTTGTQSEAAEMKEWVERRGGRYLDGVIFCYPSEVGSPPAMFLYSGSLEAWADHEQVLRLFGGATEFVSHEVTRANASLLGGAAFFIPALSSFVESATYLHRQGLLADTVRKLTSLALSNLEHVTEAVYSAIERGDHSDNEATLDTYAEGLRVIQDEFRQVEQRSPVLDAAMALLEEARAAGLSELGISAQSILLRG